MAFVADVEQLFLRLHKANNPMPKWCHDVMQRTRVFGVLIRWMF